MAIEMLESVFLSLFTLTLIGCVAAKLPILYALIVGYLIFSVYARLRQYSVPAILKMSHPPVAARREGDRPHLWPVGQAGTFELLGKEPAVKVFEPVEDGFPTIRSGKSVLGQTEHLSGGKAPS